MKTYTVKKMLINGSIPERLHGTVKTFKGLEAVRKYCGGSLHYSHNSKSWVCYNNGYEYLIKGGN